MGAIFFDLDGTLLHFTKDYNDMLRETFLQTCGQSKEAWIESYSNAFFNYFDNFEEEPYRKAFQRTEAECDPLVFVECLKENEIDMCETPEKCTIKLESLSERHDLGVLTNGVSKWQRDKLEHFNLSDYFDSVVVSYDVGYHKPNEEIFNFAEDTVEATNFWMIGDSKEQDVDGAFDAGWDPIWYQQQDFGSIF